ncbi:MULTISPECIES: hypothetical protein [unclassified Sphingomonas]|uniref:hypothetical protein n=1 Tax=unclassified Sphingomonas TaxID=196159 RepID=UPI002151853E|nr:MULTISPECIES: hypothetical protein [unclassified Sphingomonas]MCR5870692.1 hypothetical protein [Sphingomonas sp. J344]UUY00972.1 hypothetical protein LRS08_07930 [Sphingomonas sp. J315]
MSLSLFRALRAPSAADLEAKLEVLQIEAQAVAEGAQLRKVTVERAIDVLATRHAEHSAEERAAIAVRDRIGSILKL